MPSYLKKILILIIILYCLLTYKIISFSNGIKLINFNNATNDASDIISTLSSIKNITYYSFGEENYIVIIETDSKLYFTSTDKDKVNTLPLLKIFNIKVNEINHATLLFSIIGIIIIACIRKKEDAE